MSSPFLQTDTSNYLSLLQLSLNTFHLTNSKDSTVIYDLSKYSMNIVTAAFLENFSSSTVS